MAGPNSIDDSHWPEVKNINPYAVLIGYLQMAVRMLGVLMPVWATVVLLGGFVSNLEKEDFWCLTAITLVQTARVFDFFTKEKARAVVRCVMGLEAVVKARPWSASRIARWITRCFACVGMDYRSGGGGASVSDNGSAAGCCCKEVPEQLRPALRILYCLGVVQGSCCFILLCARLATRTGVALEEQVAGDYRLDARIVCKYLHKTVKGCRKDPTFAKGRNLVTYGVDLLLMEPTSTSTTSSTTATSSSSRSRSCSSKHHLSGLAILGTILQRDDDDTDSTRPLLHGQPTMMKHLLTASAAFDQVIHRLLETLGPASPYSGAVRQRAARILEEVAGSVHLEEFPGATQCIASLLGTFEEHCWRPEEYERDSDLPEEYERDWLLKEQERSYILEVVRRSRTPSLLDRLLKPHQFHHHATANGDGSVAPPPPGSDEDGGKTTCSLIVRGYAWLVISGLRVLQALAASEDNCIFISSTRGGGGGGEVSRILRPLASDGFHRDHHDEWCMIAEESLKLLTLLTAAPGETGKALRAQIASDTAGAVAALHAVLGCPRCQVALKRRAVEVLLGLGLPPPVDTSSSTAVFMGILLHIFLLPDKYFGGMSGPTHLLKKRSCTRRLAGEKLLAMVSALQQPSGGDDGDDGGAASATATTMSQQAAGVALGYLTSTVVGARIDASWRIHAARILQDLCQDYTKDDEYLKEIKKAICAAMPEVIKQLLDGCVSPTQAVTLPEAKKIVHCQAPAAAGTDLEQGVVSDDTIGEETADSHQRRQQASDDEQPEEIKKLYQALLFQMIPNRWMETDKDFASELNGIAAEMCSDKEGMQHFTTFISLRAELKRRYCWEE